MSVRELLASHTSAEITEWAGYFRLLNKKPDDAPVDEKLAKAFGG